VDKDKVPVWLSNMGRVRLKKPKPKKEKKKRGRRREGDVVKVELADGTHTYARTIPRATFAFYDCRKKKNEVVSIEEILKSKILFAIPVMNRAVTSGRWEIVGSKELEPELEEPIRFFSQDPIDPSQYFIWESDVSRPAKKEECKGLECYAVWEAEHVEDRLLDHYLGRKNKWVELVKLK
jgi:hypothetical protein